MNLASRFGKMVVFASFLTLLALGNQANAVTIGFEGVAPAGGEVAPVSPYSEGGFTLTSNLAANGILSSTVPGLNSNGTDIFAWCGSSCGLQTISLFNTAGSPFSISSMDASNVEIGSFLPGMGIVATGHFSGGGSITQTFLFGDLNTWETFSFGSGFTNLSFVDFTDAPVDSLFFPSPAFDNLVVSAAAPPVSVPEPATLLLLGSGLIGLVGVRYRQQKKA